MMEEIRHQKEAEPLPAKTSTKDRLDGLKNYSERMFNAVIEVHDELFDRLDAVDKSMYQAGANSTACISKLNTKLSDMKALMHRVFETARLKARYGEQGESNRFTAFPTAK